ncbi:MAG: hypothetical protein QOE37_2337 [Microbacteriaceae bacterium]|nr:hypothetical protein [Microbacteriaceae bacterium]
MTQAHMSFDLWVLDTPLIDKNRQSDKTSLNLLTHLSANRGPSRCTVCNCFISKEGPFDVFIFGASAI